MTGERQSIFLTGYARLPAGIVASEVSEIVGIGLEVELPGGMIIDADCTLATRVAREFVRRILVGKSLQTDLELIQAEIGYRYHGNAQKALVAAMRIAQEKYNRVHSSLPD